jgi:hypothetical protein
MTVSRLLAAAFFAFCLGLSGCGGGSSTAALTVPPAASREAPAATTVATFTAPRSSFTITRAANGFNVRNTATGANVLVGLGISLQFSDVTVNTTMGTAAGTIAPENLRTLIELYIAFFNRVPDADGLNFWITQFNAGQTMGQIANNFYTAALQFSATTGYTASMTNADFVRIVYKNVLGRTGALAPPDADVQYWAGQLDSGQATRGTLLATMLTAAHGYGLDPNFSWVTRLLVNKVIVGNAFAMQQGLNFNSTTESINQTVAIAALVTSTSTAAAIARIGIADTAFDLVASVCPQGVTTGFPFGVEATAANAGCTLADTAGAGAGGGGGGGGGSAGGGGLGKVMGALMTVTDLSDGVVVGTATTDLVNGLVTIRTGTRVGPFLMNLRGQAGATYFDEGMNQLVSFGPSSTLNALVDKWDEHVGVSPLTEAAYRYALNNYVLDPVKIAAGSVPLASTGSAVGLTAEQVRQANAVVMNAVNSRLSDRYQLVSARTLPLPIDQSSSKALTTSRYGLSAVVNGGIAQAASHFNSSLAAPALGTTANLARDLTDGRLDGYALDGSAIASAGATSYESVQLAQGGMIGANAVTQRFGSTSLTSQPLSVEQEAQLLIIGSQLPFNSRSLSSVRCDGFIDDVALLSDGSVTVVRRFPTNAGGNCSYTFSAAENAAVVTLRRFLTGVKLLSRGGEVVYALKTDGSVVGWGENFCGRVNLQQENEVYALPQVIANLRDITSISTSYSQIVARDNGGSVFTWGFGASSTSAQSGGRVACGTGQVAGGTTFTQYQDTAVNAVAGIGDIIEVHTVGSNHFALTTDGQVYAWGDGSGGLLANSSGTVVNGALSGPAIAVPTLIPGLSRVRQLAFPDGMALALLADGSVKAWGDDTKLLLGNGAQRRTTRPTTVSSLSSIALMAAVPGNGSRFLRFDGTPLQWGRASTAGFSPVVVTPSGRVRHVAPRGTTFSVLFGNGQVGREFDDKTDVTAAFR